MLYFGLFQRKSAFMLWNLETSWLAMACSSSYDDRLVAVFEAIRVCEQPLPPVIDWTSFYAEDEGGSTSSYVGPVAIHDFEGRGLGLIATCKIDPGDVVLIEDAFGLSTTPNAPIQRATSELVKACCKKVGSVESSQLEKAAFWCLHSEQELQGWKRTTFRKSVLCKYLSCLNLGELNKDEDLPQPSADWAKSEKLVGSVVSSNSRKTERWNPLTLLLDESGSLGGLWLAASLFNHSCLGNVVITYGAGKAFLFIASVSLLCLLRFWLHEGPCHLGRPCSSSYWEGAGKAARLSSWCHEPPLLLIRSFFTPMPIP